MNFFWFKFDIKRRMSPYETNSHGISYLKTWLQCVKFHFFKNIYPPDCDIVIVSFEWPMYEYKGLGLWWVISSPGSLVRSGLNSTTQRRGQSRLIAVVKFSWNWPVRGSGMLILNIVKFYVSISPLGGFELFYLVWLLCAHFD